MDDRTTTWQPHEAAPAGGRERPALVLVGCAYEPGRVGEVAVIEGRGAVLGRHGTLCWARHRPGQVRETGSVDDPQISRRQVALEIRGRAILARNEGQLPLRVNGRPVTGAELCPGDLLEIGDRLLALVVSRSSDGDEVGWPLHTFGQADAFGWVGESSSSWTLRRHVHFAARRNAHVIVLGESGTGKELVANGLHALSSRVGRPLVSRNAATIPESLADAELFGNLAGYPNPGMVARRGLIGEADGGTLFLDEFGELPVDQQARLLRVLDAGEYTRLGEARPRRSDLRLVAATNRDPSSLKHDVLARFPLRVEVPPLGARLEDVPLVAFHLLGRIASQDAEIAHRFFPGGDPSARPRVTMRLLRQLLTHPYTTHVRELEALLWQSITAARSDTLDVSAALPPGIAPHRPLAGAAARPARSSEGTPIPPRMLDPDVVQEALDRHRGHLESVWRELGLSSRHALARLIKKHGLAVRRP